MDYKELKALFEAHQDLENALAMAKYMRNQFRFYGLKTADRRALYKGFLKEAKKKQIPDWQLLNQCYEDSHRELQYFVYDYLLALNKYLTYEDIAHIRHYIKNKPWWDTIDFLCKVIGSIGLRDDRVSPLMLSWSQDEDFWIRRTSIEHQLGLKEETDRDLLEKILLNNFGSQEFFINKAIGWALRDYSKTNPDWVRRFIEKYGNQMSSLSVKEGSKYL